MLALWAQDNHAEITTSSSPVDHGVLGEVFEITEKDLIAVILQKLHKLQAEGKLETYQSQIQAKVQNNIARPNPVKDIIHTQTPRTYYLDPSITLTQDLQDHDGQIFHQKGELVNPLKLKPMTKPLLLIDGDAADHLTWALKMRKIHPLAKIILVKGEPLQMMAKMGITIYFDQFGVICKRFGIKQVPALIRQAGETLVVQEMLAEVLDQQTDTPRNQGVNQ